MVSLIIRGKRLKLKVTVRLNILVCYKSLFYAKAVQKKIQPK